MRLILLLASTLLMVSCIKSPTVSEGSSASTGGDEDAPYIWGDKTFPKIVHISSNFNEAEKTNITSMATAWKSAVNDKKTFFSFGSTVTNKSNSVNPDDLYDGILGIYKTTVWPKEIDEDALAITQIFGRRYNKGKTNEYVSIVHADILVNYADHDFETDDVQITWYYDLQTVVLHEMGHFIGLKHVPEYWERGTAYVALSENAYKASSVMYPSINSTERKRVPEQWDIDVLVDKYNIVGATGSSSISAQTNSYVPHENDPGEEMKALIELKADGTCVHKENGVVVGRHPASLKKSYR